MNQAIEPVSERLAYSGENELYFEFDAYRAGLVALERLYAEKEAQARYISPVAREIAEELYEASLVAYGDWCDLELAHPQETVHLSEAS